MHLHLHPPAKEEGEEKEELPLEQQLHQIGGKAVSGVGGDLHEGCPRQAREGRFTTQMPISAAVRIRSTAELREGSDIGYSVLSSCSAHD
ncbi:MAG: hypothetical protein HC783_16490 [Rhodobacteraceae bacterium]|nr:hypothetical protein [Paracoccaceae bacterium]